MPDINITASSASAEQSAHPTSTEVLYTIEAIPDKGRGLKATKPITKGTRILAEFPLIAVNELKKHALSDSEDEIQAKLDEASLEVVSAIMSLHNAHVDTEPELVGIVHTNAFHLDDGELGVFKDASYINHSCRPNVEAEWDPCLGMLVVHANQDIAEGDELLHDYFHSLDTFAVRQADIQKEYGFTCDCVVCSLPPSEREKSDFRREQYNRCHEVATNAFEEYPSASLALVKEMISFLKADGVVGPHEANACFLACQLAIKHGDVARAKIFGRRAYEGMAICKGKNHPDTTKMLYASKKPKSHHMYGESLLWRTSADDKPQDLKGEEFEKWLWHHAVVEESDVEKAQAQAGASS